MTTETWSAPDTARRPSCSLVDPGLVEVRFGVTGCEVDEYSRYCAARTGTWGSATPGVQQVGALAILVDHVLGEVGNHPQPAGFLPLTTQLSVDVLVRPPWSSELSATARRVLDDGSSNHCQVRVTDGSGSLLATASAWTAFAPAQGLAPLSAGRAVVPSTPPPPTTIEDLLGVRTTVAPDGTATVTGLQCAEWSNQYGTLHGGVWACATELVASRLLGTGAEPLTTTHLDIAFLRAGRTSEVHLDARTVHRGRTLGLVEVSGLDDTGRLCTRATVTGRR